MLLPPESDASWPTPSAEALRSSNALAEVIHAEIERSGGWIDFSRYMELALYAPGLGYYSAGSAKLGASGDFMTAPEISAVFGRALATTLVAELEALRAVDILELGAGSGALAAQLLEACAKLGVKLRYHILETSADLRDRQTRTLHRFGSQVTWLDGLPSPAFTGVIVANEVVDALPVSRFTKTAGQVRALGVTVAGERFAWQERSAPAALEGAVTAIEDHLGHLLPDGYRSEVRLALPAWLGGLAASLARGSVLFADYGLVRSEYFHWQRSSGTLVCHYRHRAHSDPFLYPGLQDISAWVDFSACAEAARGGGLTVAGFTTQGLYLLSTLEAAGSAFLTALSSPREQSALKTLVLPGEMGERFKIMLLRKDAGGPPLPGRDFRDRL